MKFDNTQMRRQDRLLDRADAMELLRGGEYGILSMVETRQGATVGYGIPLNYVMDGSSIYFHCAPEGYKLECMKVNPRVSFCVVGRTNVIPDKFSTEYESVVARGIMSLELAPEERQHALELLLDKYSPEYKETGMKYLEKSFHRTAVLRLDIETVSGKAKRVPLQTV